MKLMNWIEMNQMNENNKATINEHEYQLTILIYHYN